MWILGPSCYALPVTLNEWLFTRHVDDDEQIVMAVHKHWLLGVKVLFLPVLIFALLLFVLYWIPIEAVFYVVAFGEIGMVVWIIRNFFDYYLDAWIITTEGIIDVEWHGWFHRESTRVLYSDIQGVSYEIQGVLQTLLRVGTISVEKISTGNEISMDYVLRPRRVETVIMRHMEEYMHRRNLKDSRTIQDLLSGMVSRELHLKDLSERED